MKEPLAPATLCRHTMRCGHSNKMLSQWEGFGGRFVAIGSRASSKFQVLVFAILVATSASAGRSQLPSQSTGQITGSGQHQSVNGMPGGMNSDPDAQPSPFRDSARQRMNTERQKKLVSDTQRLLTLANQLKAEAAVAGTESLTPEMLHQMEEIEKLAKSVKDKMRS